MTIVLRNQLEASERSARELEAQIQQQDATSCYNVEDQLRSLVGIFTALSRDVDRWQNVPFTGASSGKSATLEEQELEWVGQFRRLEQLFSGAAQLVASLKRLGLTLDGEEAFQSAWRELRGINSFSPEEVAAGIRQIETGQVRPLAEVMNELSDRTVD
jgi:hypothetical protein